MNENRTIEHDWSETAFLCWTHLVANDISSKLLVSLQCFPGGLVVKNLPADAGEVGSLAWEDLQEEETTTHSSSVAWRIPWTEKPGRLQFKGF